MSKAKALTAYLAQPRVAFDWAAKNCCLWASVWVELVEGFNPMAGLPGTDNLRAARRLVGQLGSDMARTISERMARQPVAPRLAQLGDIALIPLDAPAFTVGICAGATFVCLTSDGSVMHVPLDAASHAWRVGGAA